MNAQPAYKNNNPSESPYFLLREPAAFSLQSTCVTVQVDGIIADVTVTQTYLNKKSRIDEAVYVFAGSTRAAVYGLDIRIGRREIHAKVKERDIARSEYEQAKKEGLMSGLLEQQRPNVFQMNVANIQPDEEVEVIMRYTEWLESRDGWYEFVYPGVVGPRYTTHGEAWVEQSIAQLRQPSSDFNISAGIKAGVPIIHLNCPSHQIKTGHPSATHTTVELANPYDKQGAKDFILRYSLQAEGVQSGLMLYPGTGGEQYFLLMAQPSQTIAVEQIPPHECIFIIDVSGSMSGSPYKLTRTLLCKLLQTLRPVDRFNIVFFEFTRRALSEQSLPATQANIDWALQKVDQEECTGGTNLYEALETAFDLPADPAYTRSFIIATDGYVSIESRAFRLVTKKRNEANLFALGVGESVNRYLIEGLAYAGAGEACFVSNQTEANQVGEQFIRTISQPLWSHIEIDWDGFEVYDVHPDPLPDLFASKPLILFGKYDSKPDGVITLKGKTAYGDDEQIIRLKDAVRTESQALRYLWARNRITYLSDYALYYEEDVHFFHSPPATTNHKKQITELGLQYNLLTKYTSFLAVDDEPGMEKIKQIAAPCAPPCYKVSSGFNAVKMKSLYRLVEELNWNEELFSEQEDIDHDHFYCQHVDSPRSEESPSATFEERKAYPEKKRPPRLIKILYKPFIRLGRLLYLCGRWLIHLFRK
ncbi:MAG: VWA domain-containing protein [Tannerellaceae bacterium]|jgi:Ca-activated chloride channel family protein|nr:VWA domain-containing protein [Tannerellaceae bacterium]